MILHEKTNYFIYYRLVFLDFSKNYIHYLYSKNIGLKKLKILHFKTILPQFFRRPMRPNGTPNGCGWYRIFIFNLFLFFCIFILLFLGNFAVFRGHFLLQCSWSFAEILAQRQNHNGPSNFFNSFFIIIINYSNFNFFWLILFKF